MSTQNKLSSVSCSGSSGQSAQLKVSMRGLSGITPAPTPIPYVQIWINVMDISKSMDFPWNFDQKLFLFFLHVSSCVNSEVSIEVIQIDITLLEPYAKNGLDLDQRGRTQRRVATLRARARPRRSKRSRSSCPRTALRGVLAKRGNLRPENYAFRFH